MCWRDIVYTTMKGGCFKSAVKGGNGKTRQTNENDGDDDEMCEMEVSTMEPDKRICYITRWYHRA